MSKVYLPTSEQMDETLANLDKIAGALGSKIDLSSWKGIQKAVRSGLAPELIPIGTQLLVNHSEFGTITFDVVAHDYLKDRMNENSHTMTLLSHALLRKTVPDRAEAFYRANATLNAGTYNFTIPSAYGSWESGTYQFTLTKALTAGAQLCLNKYADAPLTEMSVVSYADVTATTPTETVPITPGNGGTSLGTFGEELNHTHRVAHGSNNYKESAIRQFLNSSAEAGAVWTPQAKFDRPPFWVDTSAGFMNGMDEEFLAIVGEVVVPCSTNNTYESPDSTTIKGEKYTVRDKFYLPSYSEVFAPTTNLVKDDSVLLPYYASSNNTDRIKYDTSGLSGNWWLRTPDSSRASHICLVNQSGAMSYLGAVNEQYFTPMCTIV